MESRVRVGKDGAEVARRIRQLREHRGLTIRQLSDRLDHLGRRILPSGIVKLEQGERRIDIDDLAALATALDVASPSLLAGDFGSFEDLEREQVDLTRLRRRPELKAVFQAVNRALDSGIAVGDVESAVKLTAVMHEMAGGK